MSSTVLPPLERSDFRPGPAARRDDASLAARIRALLRSARLDRELADGTSPYASPELTLRARKLTRSAYRRTLANSLDEAVSIAEGRQQRVNPAAPLATREVRAARAALLDLARSLRARGDVSPQGVAMAQRLLTDGSGPLYVTREHDALWHAARRATEALRLMA